MQTLFIDQFIANEMVRAIGWTLIHSLWQGFALAVIAGVLILFTRRSKPSLRYNLFTGLFFLFMAGAAVTFFYQLESPRPLPVFEPAQGAANVLSVAAAGDASGAAPVVAEQGFMEKFRAYFNEHAPLLVTGWFVIFLGKLLWLLSGLIYIQRIKHHKTFAPAAHWASTITELSDRLGLSTTVRLLESGMVKVPTAVGLLKPLILMPVGLMTQLPADQVEAVLLHELAHIRRRDFIVNLVQHFAETVFFFNPALLWMSARIREEREHCCDDMAISVMQSKTGYIRALVSFQEYHLDARTRYALAFPGKKKLLLDRVKRIIHNNNKTLNMAEKSFLLICFSLIGTISLVFSQPDQPDQQRKEETKQEVLLPDTQQPESTTPDFIKIEPAPQDDIPVTEIPKDSSGVLEGTTLVNDEERDGRHYHMYTFKRNGILYEVESFDEGVISFIKVNGKFTYRVGDGEAQYQRNSAVISLLDGIYNAGVPAYRPYDASYKPYVPADSVPVYQQKGVMITGKITHTYEDHEYNIFVQRNKATGLAIDGKVVPNDELPGKYDLIRELFADLEKNGGIKSPTPPTPPGPAPVASTPPAPAPRAPGAVTPPTPPGPPPTASGMPVPPTPPTPPEDPYKGVIGDILNDMVADGYLKSMEGEIRFELDGKGFVVNGKEQSKDIFKKYKTKYLKTARTTFSYSRSGSSTTTKTSHVYVD